MSLFERILIRFHRRARSVRNLISNLRLPVSFLGHVRLQKASESFWKNADCTFFASEEYYLTRHKILSSTLSHLPRIDTCIDYGCGSGRFTELLAEHSRIVLAFDIAPALITQAKASMEAKQLRNITYSVLVGGELIPERSADLITFLGLTSCFIDDQALEELLQRASGWLRKSSTVISVDTLSLDRTMIFDGGNGYMAKYRSLDHYVKLFGRSGLKLCSSKSLLRIDQRAIENSLFVWTNDV